MGESERRAAHMQSDPRQAHHNEVYRVRSYGSHPQMSAGSTGKGNSILHTTAESAPSRLTGSRGVRKFLDLRLIGHLGVQGSE